MFYAPVVFASIVYTEKDMGTDAVTKRALAEKEATKITLTFFLTALAVVGVLSTLIIPSSPLLLLLRGKENRVKAHGLRVLACPNGEYNGCHPISVPHGSTVATLQKLVSEALAIPGENDPQVHDAAGLLLDPYGHDLNSLINDSVVFGVPSDRQFVWPASHIGKVHHPDASSDVVLETISLKPRVFLVQNFISDEEIDALISHAQTRLERSHVGIGKEKFDSVRTSKTAWDTKSEMSIRIQKRVFHLARIKWNPRLTDAIQIVRYGPNDLFNLHTDYFREGYENFDTALQGGTNRLVTMFIYLNDVSEGGHTVFPHSRVHKDDPGYVASSGTQAFDEMPACASSHVLSIRPKRGNAILFYNQHPDGTLAFESEHGGCPVVSGTKWGANVWIWSAPRPRFGKSTGKLTSNGGAAALEPFSLSVSNDRSSNVRIFVSFGGDEGSLVFAQSIAAQGYASIDHVINGVSLIVIKDEAGVELKRFHANHKKTAVSIV